MKSERSHSVIVPYTRLHPTVREVLLQRDDVESKDAGDCAEMHGQAREVAGEIAGAIS